MQEISCPMCGATIKEGSTFCTKCGAHRPVHKDNHCENPECIRNQEKNKFEFNDQFCDLCGKHTTYGKKVNQCL